MNPHHHHHALRAGGPICIAASLVMSSMALAIKDADNQGRWENPCKNGPDAEVPGFLMNMGPTGARGILRERSYVVKHVFKRSPADGVLEIDDEVLGANGKRFSRHTFGGRHHGFEGPMEDLGLAIEDSEGGDGVLRLMITRAGTDMTVDIRLEQLGRFSETAPLNCEKTDVLRARAYQYMLDHPGGVSSHGRCVAILALLSSDDRRVFNEGRRLAREWNKEYDDSTWSWHLGFQGIALGEYHLLTGDRSVLRTMESTMDLLRRAQWQGEIRHWKVGDMKKPVTQATLDKHQALYLGGFGHAPYPTVVERGGGGYGPMQWPTALAIMAWQLGKESGIELTHPGIEDGFAFFENGTNAAGKVAYGGEFTLNNGPVDTRQWQADTRHGASAKSGLGCLVYKLSPERPDAGRRMKLHLANIDASYRDMADGHACPLMGLTWGWAGTFASGDDRLKKKVFDQYKAWINLARCHGSDSYVMLPGRDYADSSYYRGNIRNHTTAAVALLYSYSTPKLRIQGVDASTAAGPGSTSRLPESPAGELRIFRSADRTKSIEARLVAFDPKSGQIRVRLRNGRTMDLQFPTLSREDQEYVVGRAGGDE